MYTTAMITEQVLCNAFYGFPYFHGTQPNVVYPLLASWLWWVCVTVIQDEDGLLGPMDLQTDPDAELAARALPVHASMWAEAGLGSRQGEPNPNDLRRCQEAVSEQATQGAALSPLARALTNALAQTTWTVDYAGGGLTIQSPSVEGFVHELAHLYVADWKQIPDTLDLERHVRAAICSRPYQIRDEERTMAITLAIMHKAGLVQDTHRYAVHAGDSQQGISKLRTFHERAEIYLTQAEDSTSALHADVEGVFDLIDTWALPAPAPQIPRNRVY